MKRHLAIVIGLLFWTVITAAQNPSTPSFITDSLDNYIREGMKDWNIPGLAVAIVKDGKVVVMKGYGVRDVKTNEPVDENTLFMIASNSKLFTGTALAQLEFDKKLLLDDKVSKYIRDYALYDKNTTELVTVRDLLSHRIGTKTFQGDFMFWNGNLGRREIINKMRLLKPTGLFRQNYGYCNSCFLTAGEVIPVVSGKPWEVYVYDSLLMPLGMTNTHMLTQGIDQRPNVSKPYTNQYSGILTELPYDHVDNLGPAGSMVSNVRDMSKWLLMQLDSGRLDGRRVLQWDVLRKTRNNNISISSSKSAVYPVHYTGYGLGVFMNDYAGKQAYYHTGGAFGFVTNTCFVPEAKLGIVVLTNNDNQNFFEALRYQVLDAYLGTPYTNRSKAQLPGFMRQLNESARKTSALKARVKGGEPSLVLDKYTGIYTNDLYGNIEISKDQSGKFLSIDFKGHNKLKATVEYMDNDEWLLSYNNIGYGIFPVKFKFDKEKVNSVEIRVNEFLDYDPYNFLKK
jgi:CubicO group peptidase (beta-lactamase class C family)